MSIRPYKISILDAELELLQRKLEFSRLPNNDSASKQWGEDNGVTNRFMRDTVDFWRSKYDWRSEEARLNKMPQFMTEIDVEGFGTLDIHFVHAKSSEANAVPLLFVHGWPGSFAEVEKILPRLNKAGFHVVAPSLPGYGFSSYTDKEGFKHPQHAEALHEVMLKLGYDRYFVQGGDWGSLIVRSIALRYSEHVKALHCNMIPMSRPSSIPEDQSYTPFEQICLNRSNWFFTTNVEYSQIQATKTRTLGFMLHDSPVAMLAWMADKLFLWSDNYPWTPTEIITWTLLHYFPGPTTGLVMYRENPGLDSYAIKNLKVPCAVSAFPKELTMVPRCWAETTMNVVWWKEHPEGGGHFAAYEKPEALAKDLIEFFKTVEAN